MGGPPVAVSLNAADGLVLGFEVSGVRAARAAVPGDNAMVRFAVAGQAFGLSVGIPFR